MITTKIFKSKEALKDVQRIVKTFKKIIKMDMRRQDDGTHEILVEGEVREDGGDSKVNESPETQACQEQGEKDA